MRGSLMTPAEIRAARESVGWTIREAARRWGIDHSVLSRWESGQHPAPAAYAAYITAVAAAVRGVPSPAARAPAAPAPRLRPRARLRG